MKFGVIVCPICKKAKAVELSCKTTRCPRCNKVLILEKIRIFYKTDSKDKLREVLGLINAEMDGKLKEFKDLMKKQ